MDISDFIKHMDLIYKTALTQTHEEGLAEDLTQETYLHILQALSKGIQIENPKAYLLTVLRNLFFMHLRKKYRFPVYYYGDKPPEIESVTDFDALESLEDKESIRRELSYLTHTYREVMVRYYMKNEPVELIAKQLAIPKGTVLSRLDTGRRKIKEGFLNMEMYTEHSYQPKILKLGITGRQGLKNEPFSCADTVLNQNILIIAYEKPMSSYEISRALGIPAAYVEDHVDNLVESQLMKRQGTKVVTDFVIRTYTHDTGKKIVEINNVFVKKTFEDVHDIIKLMIEQYNEIPGFSVFNETQKYLCAALSLRQNYVGPIAEAVKGAKLMSFIDMPDRPNYGKWVVTGSMYPHGYNIDNEHSHYSISGPIWTDSIYEWDTYIGRTHLAKLKYEITAEERVLLIDAVKTNNINVFQAELIPDMERYGFIKDEHGTKVPAVPYILPAEVNTFLSIENEAGKAFCAKFLDDAVNICKTHVVKYPKHISFVMDSLYYYPLGELPLYYVYEAARRGFIEIEKGKNYPVMFIVT